MGEIYKITAPNSVILNVDKQSNEIIFEEWKKRQINIPNNTPKPSYKLGRLWKIPPTNPTNPST